MSLKHAILGFLSFQPMTGYDLKKSFDHSVRHFWPANQSQIYRTLGELSDEGWVTHEVIEREERLDLKVYHISESGRAELLRWLATPIPPADYREPFLIQVYFGSRLADEQIKELFRREMAVLRELTAVYEGVFQANYARMEDHPDRRALFLILSTLEYGIKSNRAALEWMESTLERLEKEEYTFEGQG